MMMVSVGVGIGGGLVLMYFGEIRMKILSEIGMMMVIGVVGKKGILIVEFGKEKEEGGEEKMEGMGDGGVEGLGGMVMRSGCRMVGLVGVGFGWGEGGNEGIGMGVGVVGGMLVCRLVRM